MRLSLRIILIHVSMLYPCRVTAQDGNFSLDVGSNGASEQSGSSTLDDFGSTSDLFGDAPLGNENQESTAGKQMDSQSALDSGLKSSPGAASDSAKVGSGQVGLGAIKSGDSKVLSPSKSNAGSKSDTQIQSPALTNPASPIAPKADITAKDTPQYIEKNGMVDSMTQPLAPLVGDGSVAPV
jgi:hypothetical protein